MYSVTPHYNASENNENPPITDWKILVALGCFPSFSVMAKTEIRLLQKNFFGPLTSVIAEFNLYDNMCQ